jgi:CRISPR type III-A-associated RAMP protein Csm4
MQTAFVARFYPSGPWRIAADSGDPEDSAAVLHSDAVYSAVTWAMQRLGFLPEWLEAVFRRPDSPAVRFSSAFPFLDPWLFVPPPSHLWPPPPSTKVRWKGARLIPLEAAQALLKGEALAEEQWRVDGESQCLLPAEWESSPFRFAVRSGCAVDRLEQGAAVKRLGCVEFASGAGMWLLAAFSDAEARSRWEPALKAALLLLGDSGVGGRRSAGWGGARRVEFEEADWWSALTREEPPSEAAESTAWWLLSAYLPSEQDAVDWNKGQYRVLERNGRVDAVSGGALKPSTRMVAEGAVLFAPQAPRGRALDVAPEGLPHPVYRAGFALAAEIVWREPVK